MELLEEFIEMRIKIGKPMTERAKKSLLKKLDTIASSDLEKELILKESIANGWQSIYPIKLVKLSNTQKDILLLKKLLKK